ncbi:MAG: hypothetical protein M3Y82_00645 [Verrucomicrobiota bacterium]|nr:hypothetical protein [Verrucomicrobiota bacterium]
MSRYFLFIWLVVVSFAGAATFQEDFSGNPADRDWKIFGDTNLFQWNAITQNLAVTWDSSRTNSYFYYSLKTILNRNDDFSFAFDLRMTEIIGGANPNKPSAFPLAIGFLNLKNALHTNFFRGTGLDSPNLVEFNFFPDTGFGPTIWPAIWATNSSLNYNGSSDYTILDLPLGITARVALNYTASNRTLVTVITTNGISIGNIHPVSLSANFTDFQVDAFAIESYSDFAQDPLFPGSILAHGIFDNLIINTPPPPVQNLRGFFSADQWQVEFLSRTNWIYGLERTENFQSWNNVSEKISGNGGQLILQDTNTSLLNAHFYRVKAER